MDAHLHQHTRDRKEGFPPVRVGNDVVDLLHPRCRDRSREDPLLERILASEERRWLDQDSGEGTWLLRLWALWAAKETAFKVACKLPAPPSSFRHAQWVCRLKVHENGDTSVPEHGGGMARIRGGVRGPDLAGEVTVDGGSDGAFVHLAGWSPSPDGEPLPRLEMGLEGRGASEAEGDAPPEDLDSYRAFFSDREWEGVHSAAAARARLMARSRLRAHLGLGEEEGQVEILTSQARPGRTPPRVRVHGVARPDLDVSLSHHGRFVAWAILIPPPSGLRGAGGS